VKLDSKGGAVTLDVTLPQPADRRLGWFRSEGRTIGALLLRALRLKFRESRLSYLLAIAEPCLQFAVLFAIFSMIGRHPGFGHSLVLFLASGIIPFFLFTHLSARITNSLRAAIPMSPLRVVGSLNLATAQAILEFVTIIIFMVVVLSLLAALGVHGAIPSDPIELAGSVVALGLFAFGVGLINSALYALFRMWALIYGVASRSLIFVSGLFYAPELFLPPVYRDILAWNPVLQGLSWFRTAIYPTYPQSMLDRGYLLACALGAIAAGVVLDRAIGRVVRR
jgi:capsular polysaccharide transport system permease protein